MRVRTRKPCSYFTPIDDMSSETKCSRCVYYSSRNCIKNKLDEINYPDDDFY